jgi:outer membrane protein assembly factor BamB
MTFWNDMPKHRAHRWSRRTRRRAGAGVVVGIVVLITIIGGAIISSGSGDATAESAKPAKSGKSATPQLVESKWALTLADDPKFTLTARAPARPPEAVVIADRHVYSVALADGTFRWTTPMQDVGEGGGAMAGDTILVARRTGFTALERSTGKVRWQTDVTETPSSVALVGPAGPTQMAVVSTVEGGLVGLDSHTGTQRWSIRLSQSPMGTFAVDEKSGLLATIWAGDPDGAMLRVIDGATGTVRWEQRVRQGIDSPVIGDGLVVIGSVDPSLASDVRAFALADGTPRWTTKAFGSFQPEEVPLVDHGNLFMVDTVGHVMRIRMADGKRRWMLDTGALSIAAAPIRVDDAILFSNLQGEVITVGRDSGPFRGVTRPGGSPNALVATRRFVVVLQRQASRDTIQAFDRAWMAAPARIRK